MLPKHCELVEVRHATSYAVAIRYVWRTDCTTLSCEQSTQDGRKSSFESIVSYSVLRQNYARVMPINSVDNFAGFSDFSFVKMLVHIEDVTSVL